MLDFDLDSIWILVSLLLCQVLRWERQGTHRRALCSEVLLSRQEPEGTSGPQIMLIIDNH